MDSEMERSVGDLLRKEDPIERLAREVSDLRRVAARLADDATRLLVALDRDVSPEVANLQRGWVLEGIEAVGREIDAQTKAAEARRASWREEVSRG